MVNWTLTDKTAISYKCLILLAGWTPRNSLISGYGIKTKPVPMPLVHIYLQKHFSSKIYWTAVQTDTDENIPICFVIHHEGLADEILESLAKTVIIYIFIKNILWIVPFLYGIFFSYYNYALVTDPCQRDCTTTQYVLFPIRVWLYKNILSIFLTTKLKWLLSNRFSFFSA